MLWIQDKFPLAGAKISGRIGDIDDADVRKLGRGLALVGVDPSCMKSSQMLRIPWTPKDSNDTTISCVRRVVYVRDGKRATGPDLSTPELLTATGSLTRTPYAPPQQVCSGLVDSLMCGMSPMCRGTKPIKLERFLATRSNKRIKLDETSAAVSVTGNGASLNSVWGDIGTGWFYDGCVALCGGVAKLPRLTRIERNITPPDGFRICVVFQVNCSPLNICVKSLVDGSNAVHVHGKNGVVYCVCEEEVFLMCRRRECLDFISQNVEIYREGSNGDGAHVVSSGRCHWVRVSRPKWGCVSGGV